MQLVEQQKQIINLLNTLMTQSTNSQTSAATHDQQNTPAASHPAVTATISHQESTSAYTESSILEDLLELTSDVEFMMSLSSGNSAPVSSHQMTQPSSTQITATIPLAPLQQKAPVLDLLPAPVLDSLPQFPTPAMQPPQLPTPAMQPPQLPTPAMQPPQLPTPVMQPPQLPSPVTHSSQLVSTTPQAMQPAGSSSEVQSVIQKPPFDTPPKLLPIDLERVMIDYPGTDVAFLRRLTTALARDAIFGREALCRSSLSGKNNTGCLEKHKLDYIKAVVKSRVPNMP